MSDLHAINPGVVCRFALVAILGAGVGSSQAATPAPIKAVFDCAGGSRITATFTGGAHPSVALELSDGRRLTVPAGLSGSGARYANADESFVFWNKGDTAFIEERGKTTYDDCKARP